MRLEKEKVKEKEKLPNEGEICLKFMMKIITNCTPYESSYGVGNSNETEIHVNEMNFGDGDGDGGG